MTQRKSGMIDTATASAIVAPTSVGALSMRRVTALEIAPTSTQLQVVVEARLPL